MNKYLIHFRGAEPGLNDQNIAAVEQGANWKSATASAQVELLSRNRRLKHVKLISWQDVTFFSKRKIEKLCAKIEGRTENNSGETSMEQ